MLCLKRQMKITQRLAVSQEEHAPVTTALLSPAHLHPCLLLIFLYICPVPVPYFHSPFSPHHLSLLALPLYHFWGACCNLCFSAECHSCEYVTQNNLLAHCCWGSADAAVKKAFWLQNIPFRSYSKSAEQIYTVHSDFSQHQDSLQHGPFSVWSNKIISSFNCCISAS